MSATKWVNYRQNLETYSDAVVVVKELSKEGFQRPDKKGDKQFKIKKYADGRFSVKTRVLNGGHYEGLVVTRAAIKTVKAQFKKKSRVHLDTNENTVVIRVPQLLTLSMEDQKDKSLTNERAARLGERLAVSQFLKEKGIKFELRDDL